MSEDVVEVFSKGWKGNPIAASAVLHYIHGVLLDVNDSRLFFFW